MARGDCLIGDKTVWLCFMPGTNPRVTYHHSFCMPCLQQDSETSGANNAALVAPMQRLTLTCCRGCFAF